VFSLSILTLHSEGEVQGAADDLVEELRDDPSLSGATFLVGPNWGIQCPRAWALKLKTSLGGAIAAVP
jgi:hypothetical protein